MRRLNLVFIRRAVDYLSIRLVLPAAVDWAPTTERLSSGLTSRLVRLDSTRPTAIPFDGRLAYITLRARRCHWPNSAATAEGVRCRPGTTRPAARPSINAREMLLSVYSGRAIYLSARDTTAMKLWRGGRPARCKVYEMVVGVLNVCV